MIILLHLLATFFVKQDAVWMPLWPGCTLCSGWFLDLVFTRATMSLPAKGHSSQLASSLSWCLGLFLPRCRIWHFLLLNFTRSCKPISPACRGITGWWHDTMALAATPLSFVSPADLLRTCCPINQGRNEHPEKDWPQYRDTLLFTHIQEVLMPPTTF